MKLSIWQQWSSNHSADYTVVGEFSTVEEAEQAYNTLRDAIRRIVEEDRQRSKKDRWNIRQTELELASSYGFDWQEPVDWLCDYDHRMSHWIEEYRKPAEDRIHHFEHLVFVEAPGGSTTWQTGHQFLSLMQTLGGEAKRKVFMGMPPGSTAQMFANLTITVHFDMVDADKRQRLVTLLNRSLKSDDMLTIPPDERMPWLLHHPDYERLLNLPLDHFLLYANERMKPDEDRSVESDLVYTAYRLRDEAKITFDSIDVDHSTVTTVFQYADVATALPAFINWLQSEGATDVTYSIKQDGPYLSDVD